MKIETNPKITQKRDKDNLGLTFKHPFIFKRGINAAKREKGALFPKGVACSCLLPLPKNLPQQLHTQLHAPPLNAREEG